MSAQKNRPAAAGRFLYFSHVPSPHLRELNLFMNKFVASISPGVFAFS
jgi:hypothetical protein